MNDEFEKFMTEVNSRHSELCQPDGTEMWIPVQSREVKALAEVVFRRLQELR